MGIYKEIVIIGSGISGLWAGKILENRGISFLILEAKDRIGGRIYSKKDWNDFPLEVGAEEVHGTQSAWADFLKNRNVRFFNPDVAASSYLYLDGALWEEDEIPKKKGFKQAADFDDYIEDYQGGDCSLKALLDRRPVHPRFYPYMESAYGMEYGAATSKISMHSLQQVYNKWSSGEDNVALRDDNYSDILKDEFHSILPNVRLKTVVESVNYQGDRVVVKDWSGNEYECDAVLVGASLGVLQTKLIAFYPELPEKTMKAIDGLKIEKGIKLSVCFDRPFWPEDMGSLYTNSMLIPHFWVAGKGNEKGVERSLTLSTIVLGEDAKRLGSNPQEQIHGALKILDVVFDGKASSYFDRGNVQDWGKEPFILGTYTYPSPQAEKYRRWLAHPVDGKVFFMGEATNMQGHAGTVHGAVESAIRVIEDLEEYDLA